MDADPGKMKNLALDAAYQEQLNCHRRLLTEWARKTKDRDSPYITPKIKT